MASYTATHACGHTTTLQLYGRHEARHARLTAMSEDNCPACRAAGSTLTGSVKQVAWAEDIRRAALPKAEAAYAAHSAKIASAPAGHEAGQAHMQAALDAAMDAIRNRTSARDWIDGQSPDADLLIALREAAKTAPKG